MRTLAPLVPAGLLALLAAVLPAPPAHAAEIALTVVNVVSPQDVKIWTPTTIVAKRGDTVKLKLINRHDQEHGFEIAAVGVKVVVPGSKAMDVGFTADKAGVFAVKCQLHPAHVVGQLLVVD